MSSSLLSRREAAARLGISLATLDAERASGRLAYIQRGTGCKVWLRESDLETWLARCTHQAIPPQVLAARPTYRRRRVI